MLAHCEHRNHNYVSFKKKVFHSRAPLTLLVLVSRTRFENQKNSTWDCDRIL